MSMRIKYNAGGSTMLEYVAIFTARGRRHEPLIIKAKNDADAKRHATLYFPWAWYKDTKWEREGDAFVRHEPHADAHLSLRPLGIE